MVEKPKIDKEVESIVSETASRRRVNGSSAGASGYLTPALAVIRTEDRKLGGLARLQSMKR